MINRKTLKNRAKAVLSRSFPTTLLACLITAVAGSGIGLGTGKIRSLDFEAMSNLRIAAIIMVAGILLIVGLAFYIFVTSPLSVGLKHFMLCSADGDTRLDNLLYPFKNGYKNIVWVMFVKQLYIFLWSLAGLIPIAVGLWKFGLYQKISGLIQIIDGDSYVPAFKLLFIMGILLVFTLIFSVPAFIKELQYSLVEYILAENPDMKRSSAIGKSKEMMVGNKWAFVKLMLSFTGWYIAANMFCCLGSIILRPYIEATCAQFYLEISGQGKDYGFEMPGNPFSRF